MFICYLANWQVLHCKSFTSPLILNKETITLNFEISSFRCRHIMLSLVVDSGNLQDLPFQAQGGRDHYFRGHHLCSACKTQYEGENMTQWLWYEIVGNWGKRKATRIHKTFIERSPKIWDVVPLAIWTFLCDEGLSEENWCSKKGWTQIYGKRGKPPVWLIGKFLLN